MTYSKNPQDKLAEELKNGIWIRIDRVNHILEDFGVGDFVENMPVLFALYYYASLHILHVAEDPIGLALQQSYRSSVADLDDDCLIEEEEAAEMIDEFHDAYQSMVEVVEEVVVPEGKDKKTLEGDTMAVLLVEAERLMGFYDESITFELAAHLEEFVLYYRTGGPSWKYPLS